MNIVKTGVILFIALTLISCASMKYNGSHIDNKIFLSDLKSCVKSICKKNDRNSLSNPQNDILKLSYGGGGGGGMNARSKPSISLKMLNLCLEQKGYSQNKEGTFVLPLVSCR